MNLEIQVPHLGECELRIDVREQSLCARPTDPMVRWLVTELQSISMWGRSSRPRQRGGIRYYLAAKGCQLLLSNRTQTVGTPEMDIITTEDGVLASLQGRFDIDNSPAIRERILALLQRSSRQTVSIDLSRVTHIDCSGIATLIEALRIARGGNIGLQLQGLHDRLLRLFEITGLLSLFNASVRINDQSEAQVI